MKKSIYATALAGVVALTLAACGDAPEEDAPEPAGDDTAASQDTDDTAAEDNSDFVACLISDQGGWDDQSFNQSAMEGAQQAEAELGITLQNAESQSDADFGPNVDAMVQQGCNITIGVGFLLEDPIQGAAEANDDMHFGLVDATFEDPGETESDPPVPVELPNGKPIIFNTAEAAYLAGYVAAGMTETGTVATFGGMQIPSVAIFMDGFVDGVAAYNDTHDTDVEVLGWDKDAQNGAMTGDFENPENGYNTTQQFIDAGADIILPVAGPVGSGSLRAADENEGISVIWVDSDGYEQPENEAYNQYILTSVLKLIGNAVFDSIAGAAGGEFDAEPYVGTLENGGVDLAEFRDDVELQVPEELAAEIDDLRQQIIDGDLEVDSPSAID